MTDRVVLARITYGRVVWNAAGAVGGLAWIIPRNGGATRHAILRQSKLGGRKKKDDESKHYYIFLPMHDGRTLFFFKKKFSV
jgi:hypothetical protein